MPATRRNADYYSPGNALALVATSRSGAFFTALDGDVMHTIDANDCARMMQEARSVVALTGAGISTAAGIPDFRGPRGLYITRQYDPETVFDIEYFLRHPQPFFDFSRDFIGVVRTIRPTFSHIFLADHEKQKKLCAVITQNIDPLHQQAGSRKVICLHGNYSTSHCLDCRTEFDYASFSEKLFAEPVPRCVCGGVIKPDIVFFGEAVYGMEDAAELTQKAELMLVLGSSLAVYPAAGLPALARRVIIVNQGEVNHSGAECYQADCPLDEFLQRVQELLR